MENVLFLKRIIMILVLSIAVLVWFIWGALFDHEEKLGPVEKVIRHPGRCTKNLLTKWIKDAEDVLKDPNSTEEQRERAMKDIEYFSDLLR